MLAGGEKVNWHKIHKTAVLQDTQEQTPARHDPAYPFPGECLCAVKLPAAFECWAVCFKLQEAVKQILEVKMEWRTGKSLKSVTVAPDSAPQSELKGLQPGAEWQMILPWNVLKRNRRRSLSVWSELIYSRRNLQLLPDWKPGLVLPSDGWMEFRSLILSPEMSFKSTDTFSKQVKL